jgi:hypothetical protein
MDASRSSLWGYRRLISEAQTLAFFESLRNRRSEVSGHLADDVRQGAHARKVMESYQSWFGEGPELSVLRMLGLFDRPADEKALGDLLKSRFTLRFMELRAGRQDGK